ncbi:hypothetical protein CANINC_004473 [Pichia inconspicua]|uniref:Diphthine--ammonia ligase n=1 Tax=Pichia inconspicua TaxID=52247 RepID=A0A4T0WVC9_9ASCO|nr:hypothetical protein CANINC_004473 [[Candida] inconspicua]
MKFVALVSGGKDSCFNILHCLVEGHELICLANLYPESEEGNDEIDSYMYQTVGHDVLTLYERCIGKPMYREPILGKANNQKLEYDLTDDDNDETEDLYRLLSKVKKAHPEIEGVSVGAILSNYQRTRVEDVCSRLGLTSLAYLWQRNQAELMNEMCLSGMDARIIKVAAYGLNNSHLGMTLEEIHPTLTKLNNLMGVHICGEGGEFETSVFDAPFFKYGRIKITESEVVKHTNDDVWYLKMKVGFEEKDVVEEEPDWKEFIRKPPALSEKFDEILRNINEIEVGEAAETEDESKTFQPRFDIFEAEDKVYISNINSQKVGVEEQIVDIFNQLGIELNKRGLNYQNIQSSKLLIKDMTNFGKINEVYVKYFTKSLPPSRVCIETLINSDAQLSVVVMKNLEDKIGLHIQGRSYWAPCNIGPYSQAIGNKKEKMIYISGQIPLIPESMELSCSDFKYNLVLSLQHYDSIKSVMNHKCNLLTVCYIKDIRYSKIVAAAFKEYIDYCQEEEDIGGTRDLIIVQVTELPRGADVEWSGIAFNDACEDLNYLSDSENEDEGSCKSTSTMKSVKVHSIRDLNSLATMVSNAKPTSFYEIYASRPALGELGELSESTATLLHCDTVPVVAAARGDNGQQVLAHVIEYPSSHV